MLFSRAVSQVLPDVAKMLSTIEVGPKGMKPFVIDGGDLTLSVQAAGTTAESRTKAVGQAMEQLRQNGVITGWRDELYPISDSTR